MWVSAAIEKFISLANKILNNLIWVSCILFLFSEYPSALLFQQKLSEKDLARLEVTVRKLLSQKMDVESDDIDVQYEVISCLSDNK